MKSMFRGYIPYTPEEIANLWKDCVFSFDTNVLLNSYRCSKPTVAKILEVMGKLKGRVWLTHQAAWEFISKRDSIAYSQIGIFKSSAVAIKKLAQDFKIEKSEMRKDSLVDVDAIRSDIEKSTASLLEKIEEKRREHTEWLKNDPALRLYCSLFEGFTGDKPAKEKLKMMEEDCSKRKAANCPPGFNDDGHGDGIIWLQLIEYAKVHKKPIIFVTDDAKDDWWSKVSGETIRPHPALTQEMYDEAGVGFYMYPMHRFIEEAGKLNQVVVENNVIREIERIDDHRELFIPEVCEAERRNDRIEDLNDVTIRWLGEFEQAARSARDRAAVKLLEETVRAANEAYRTSGIEEAVRCIKHAARKSEEFTLDNYQYRWLLDQLFKHDDARRIAGRTARSSAPAQPMNRTTDDQPT